MIINILIKTYELEVGERLMEVMKCAIILIGVIVTLKILCGCITKLIKWCKNKNYIKVVESERNKQDSTVNLSISCIPCNPCCPNNPCCPYFQVKKTKLGCLINYKNQLVCNNQNIDDLIKILEKCKETEIKDSESGEVKNSPDNNEE